MKNLLSFLLAVLILLCASISQAAGPYLPLTETTGTQLMLDVRTQYWPNEFPAVKNWPGRLHAIIVTFDPTTNNAQYMLEHYGLTMSESYTVVGCPAWRAGVEIDPEKDRPWTVPVSVLNSDTEPLYWIFNSDFLNTGNDQALIGLMNHEFGHLYSQKNGFEQESIDIATDPFGYGNREWMNELFVLSAKGKLGAFIPSYALAKWIHGLYPPVAYPPDPLPAGYVVNPYLTSIRRIPQMKYGEIRCLFFERAEQLILRNPDKTLVEILGPTYVETYNYLMSN